MTSWWRCQVDIRFIWGLVCFDSLKWFSVIGVTHFYWISKFTESQREESILFNVHLAFFHSRWKQWISVISSILHMCYTDARFHRNNLSLADKTTSAHTNTHLERNLTWRMILKSFHCMQPYFNPLLQINCFFLLIFSFIIFKSL